MADLLNLSLPFVKKPRAELKRRDSSSSMNKKIEKKTSGKDVYAKKNLIEEEIKECRCNKILIVDDNNFNIMAI